MKLAIGHYHLNRGGVTRVIENQLLALDRVLGDGSTHEALILYGGRCEGWPTNLADRLERIRLRLQPLPEFDYDSEQSGSPGDLESRLLEALRAAGFRPANTIVHFHNPSIGKNAALPRAVWALADRDMDCCFRFTISPRTSVRSTFGFWPTRVWDHRLARAPLSPGAQRPFRGAQRTRSGHPSIGWFAPGTASFPA